MSESLSTRVAQFVQAQPARRSGKARAAVVALRAEIQQAVSDGWSVRAIWQTLRAEGAVQVGYHAFRRYVAELVTQPAARGRRPAVAIETSHRPAAPVARTEAKPRRFKHDPRPQLDKIYG
jgi:hypothetical protein